jgi:hypothetical protein
VTLLTRSATALALGVALCLTGACGSSAPTATDDAALGDGLTATVPPGPRSSTTTAATSTSGPDPTTTAPGELPQACELLTQADATAAFGEPALGGDQRADECWWSSANDLKTVNLIRRTDDVATWRSGYQSSFWTPNDLGDEGYTGTALDSVVWRVGDVQYEVNVVYSTSGDAHRIATDLAEKVASRL